MESFDVTWERVHRNQDWGKYPSEEVIRFVARNFYSKDRNTVKLLDAGCGSGSITWYLAREGFRVFAFDGSKTAIMKAANRLKQENLTANIVVGDAINLNYGEKFFDGIIDSAMICANTVKNIEKILKEFHRMLKDNGKIFSTGLFKVGMTGYGSGKKIEEHTYQDIEIGNLADIGTVHFFDEDQIRTLWVEAGFMNIRIDSLERTDLGGVNKVSYYMVEAEKQMK
jgi:SAM-dependent methyltransferase